MSAEFAGRGWGLDAERRELERQAATDPTAVTRLQALNDRVGLGPDDAEYLMRYTQIVDKFVGRGRGDVYRRSISLGEAKRQVIALNQEFALKVGAKTIKSPDMLPGAHLVKWFDTDKDNPEDEAWMPSEVC